MDILIKACKRLLIEEPFYGLFLLNFQKIVVDDDHQIKTAAVAAQGLNLVLYVNKNFFHELNQDEQISVLKHEVSHVAFFHLTNYFDAPIHHNMNIAQDVEINQNIKNLPDGCVTLDSLSKKLEKKLEKHKGSWYYYKEIDKFRQEHPELCSPSGECGNDFKEIDDHSQWPSEKLSEVEKKLLENQIKNKLKDTAEQVKKQQGIIPGEFSEILERIKDKPPIFNWRQYFRRLVGNSITSDIILTRMKPSKRFPDARGIRFKRKPKILVGVDTSGSINTKDLIDFFVEIHHMWKSGVSVTVAECDTQINKVFEYKGQQNIEINGRGGTILTPIIDYYKSHRDFSVCILFTDGYCETTMPICNNLIWVITSNGNKSKTFSPGKIILIP